MGVIVAERDREDESAWNTDIYIHRERYGEGNRERTGDEKERECASLTWLSFELLSRSSTIVSIAGTALSCLFASFNPCHSEDELEKFVRK
jgi:hypothetical protein